MISNLKYASARVYLAEGGIMWKAVATVERAGPDGLVVKTEFSAAQSSPAEALADALNLAGFMESEGE